MPFSVNQPLPWKFEWFQSAKKSWSLRIVPAATMTLEMAKRAGWFTIAEIRAAQYADEIGHDLANTLADEIMGTALSLSAQVSNAFSADNKNLTLANLKETAEMLERECPRRYVEWVEPSGQLGEEIRTVRITVEKAIAQQRTVAESKGYSYTSDAEALEDFMVVHWATIVVLPVSTPAPDTENK